MVEYPFKTFIFTFVPPMHLLTMTMLLHLLVYHNYQLSNSLAHMACIWYTAITYQKIKLPRLKSQLRVCQIQVICWWKEHSQ